MGKFQKICAAALLVLGSALSAETVWLTRTMAEFQKGTFGNAGDNIYVSANGILQRIRNSDLNNDGFFDLLFCNSQEHEEYVSPESYHDVLNNPAKKTFLAIGGLNSALAVEDLNGDGFEDAVFSCGWDGESWVPNNTIFYGSEKGITNHYIHRLPFTSGRSVTGDFNGDGLKDIIFFKGKAEKAEIAFFPNSKQGFAHFKTFNVDSPELKADGSGVNYLISVPDNGGDSIIMRLGNGALAIMRFEKDFISLKPEIILDSDPDYKKVTNRWSDNNQYVPEPEARPQKITLGKTLYIFGARKKSCALYPFVNGKLDMKNAIFFNVDNALSITSGDVRNTGFHDVVIAARDAYDGKETSWYYPAVSEAVFSEKSRVPVFTKRATDVKLADFGGKALSLVIMESNTDNSYSGKTLVYKQFAGKDSLKHAPLELPCGDARIALTPKIGNRHHLLVANTRSGNATSKLPVTVYYGSKKGYTPDNKTDLMANGAMDGFFADLNDDSHPDIIVANEVELAPELNDGSYIFYNKNGSFAPDADLKLDTKRATGIVVADFDRNGYLDIVFTAIDESALTIYYGEKNNRYRSEKIKLGEKSVTLWLASGDLNNDGFIDLVVPVTQFGKSCILWGGKEGFSYSRRRDFNISGSATARVADMNNDGLPDVIFGAMYPSLGKPHDTFVSIFYNTPKGFDDTRRTMLLCNNADSLAVGDFNKDGLPDLYVGSYDNRRTRKLDSFLYWNDPVDGFTKDNYSPIRTEASCGVIVGDFDGNGYPDLALANHKVNTKHNSYSRIWYNEKGVFDIRNTVILPSSGPHGMISAPFTNVVTRSDSEFYTSKIFELKEKASSIEFSADMTMPAWNKCNLYLRSGETEKALAKAQWKSIPWKSSVSAKEFSGRFFQYRLELVSPDGKGTPRIKEIKAIFK